MSNEGGSDNGGKTPLSNNFDEAKGETFQDESVKSDLERTSEALITHKEHGDTLLHQQDEKRDAIRDQIAATPLPMPSYDLGQNDGRDIQTEYENRIGDWHRETDAIEASLEQTRQDIRTNGETLVDHWEDVEFDHAHKGDIDQDMPWDMRAAFNEQADNDYFLDQEFSDGLNFEDNARNDGSGHEGGRGR